MEAKLLSIDLSSRTCNIEEIPGKIIRQYLGGRGLGAYLLHKLVPAKADPLGEENHLIFAAGPASGTNFFYSFAHLPHLTQLPKDRPIINNQ